MDAYKDIYKKFKGEIRFFHNQKNGFEISMTITERGKARGRLKLSTLSAKTLSAGHRGVVTVTSAGVNFEEKRSSTNLTASS